MLLLFQGSRKVKLNMKKVTRQISISAEVDSHIKSFFPDKEFSGWVENNYRKQNMGITEVYKQEKELENKLKRIKKQIEFIKTFEKKQRTAVKMDVKEILFWRQTSKILKGDMNFLEGRINLYKNIIIPGNKISVSDFIQKLKAFEKREGALNDRK